MKDLKSLTVPPGGYTYLVEKLDSGGYQVVDREGSVVYTESDPNHAENAIQAAIDALPAGGGVIKLLEGTFRISSEIVIDRFNESVDILGSGWTATKLLKVGTAGRMLRLHNVRGSIVANMWFEGDHKTGQNPIIFVSFYAYDILFQRLLLERGEQHGIYLTNLWNTRILDCSIEFMNNGFGIFLETTRDQHRFLNVERCYFCNSKRAISLKRGSDYVPEYISIKNCLSMNMSEHDFVLNNVKHGEVLYNKCGGTGGATVDGIYIYGSETYPSEDILVMGNHVIENRRYGINIPYGADYIIVRDNDVRGSSGINIPTDVNLHGIVFNKYIDLFMDVLAEDVDYVHAAITPDGAEHTDTTNPDVPRNVMIRITNTDGANPQTPDGGDIVVEGVDAKGNSISETLTVPNTEIAAGGTSDVYGSKAFATVTKVTYYSESNTNITVSVGISDKLGLSNPIYATGDVYKVKKNNADIAVPTVDVTNGTVDCATITGGDDFTIYYRSNLNIVE